MVSDAAALSSVGVGAVETSVVVVTPVATFESFVISIVGETVWEVVGVSVGTEPSDAANDEEFSSLTPALSKREAPSKKHINRAIVPQRHQLIRRGDGVVAEIAGGSNQTDMFES
jgi:hypothetical protein